jgi:hypothetical protein
LCLLVVQARGRSSRISRDAGLLVTGDLAGNYLCGDTNGELRETAGEGTGDLTETAALQRVRLVFSRLYRSRSRHSDCDLRFGRMSRLRQLSF